MALITQEALAARLDVSVATVSRALRHDASVHPHTRARVLKLAAESGYEPVEDGRSKRRRVASARGHVTVIIPSEARELDAVHWPHAGVLAGMSRAAQGAAFQLTVLPHASGPLAPLPADTSAVAVLMEFPTDQMAELAAAYPVASLVYDYHGIERMDVVGGDDFRALGELVAHLHAAGHRKIGFLTYAGTQNWELERLGAYAAAMWRNGLRPDPDGIVALHSIEALSPDDHAAWRQAHAAGVTAWICANDLLAYAFLALLRDADIDVPGAVSIVGFDGVEPMPGLPRLTTMRPPVEAIGYALLNCLRTRMSHPTQPGRRVLFRCALIEGTTVGHVAAVGAPAEWLRSARPQAQADAPRAEVRHNQQPLTYDGKPETRAFWGGNLPHWDVLGRPIFLTIHVAGAIPAEAANRIRREAADLADREHTDYAQRLRRIFQNMETWLDRNDQQPVLTHPQVSAVLRDAITEREDRGWWRVLHWVVMPSHLHLLYVGGTASMKTVVTDFKRWTGRRANALLGRAGERFWQREWFDHWSRSADETDRIAAYIRANPVRSDLVASADDWPHGSWSMA